MADGLGAPRLVHLYDGVPPAEVKTHELAAFLRRELPRSNIDVRTDFLRCWLADRGNEEDRVSSVAARLAQARVRRPDKHETGRQPLGMEVQFERRFLAANSKKPVGILYDAHWLMAICAELISPEEATPQHCHLMLTNQLFGTWDDSDHRYHARAALYGFPCMMSTAGLIEAPAKPREFYLARGLGASQATAKETVEGRCLAHGDARLHEAMKGYLLQALFYHATGDPYCDSRDCRLFNAHWQEDLIHAQTRPDAGLCPRHRQALERALCT